MPITWRTRERGIAYARGEVFFVDGRGTSSLMRVFTTLGVDAIAEGVAELGRIVRKHTRARAAVGACPLARQRAARRHDGGRDGAVERG